MRSRFTIDPDYNLYFITSSIHCWVPILFNENLFKIVLDSLVYCQKEKGLQIYGYVIMLNHMHGIIGHSDPDKIPGVIRDFKRHTSKKISECLAASGRYSKLFWVKLFHSKEENKVWQEGYHPEAIFTDKFFEEKLDYIHFNPVKAGFVEEPEHWSYSSARNYYLDDNSLITLDEL